MKIGGAIPIAKIVGAHGLHGTCKVYCYGECGDILSNGRDIFVKTADGVLLSYEIDWAKPHARTVLLALKGIKGIGVVQLDEQDVIRHNLVKKIIDAYKSIETD